MNVLNDLPTKEDLLVFLKEIHPSYEQYAAYLFEYNDYRFDFEHRLKGTLYLESNQDLYLIYNSNKWSQVTSEMSHYDIGVGSLFSNGIYISKLSRYIIVVGHSFYSTVSLKKEIPPL